MARNRQRYRRAGCLGKAKLSEKSARRTADSMTAVFGEVMEPYRCRVCGNWHVGHSGMSPAEFDARLAAATAEEVERLKRNEHNRKAHEMFLKLARDAEADTKIEQDKVTPRKG